MRYILFTLLGCLFFLNSSCQSFYKNYTQDTIIFPKIFLKKHFFEYPSTIFTCQEVKSFESLDSKQTILFKNIGSFFDSLDFFYNGSFYEENMTLTLVRKYLYSKNYNSYLLLFSNTNKDEYFRKNMLFLVNEKNGILLSKIKLASYFLDNGYEEKKYSIFLGFNTFCLREEFVNDVIIEGKFERPKSEKKYFYINPITGNILLSEF